ncbi:MAG: methyltransferase domain-containing protein [Alphaproteobacteria bacterium]|nr:methyltransferase domain-containing protein [Alphaproteobacteria bacterium]
MFNERADKTISGPLIGVGKSVLRRLFGSPEPAAFRNSPQYWEDRYKGGGNSGAGSYGRLSRFKADVINDFVGEHHVQTVLEFGCGDGAQLALAKYPRYLGIDVSHEALRLCRNRFGTDPAKRFMHVTEYDQNAELAELVLSLDVVYHLIEDSTFCEYMARLIGAAERGICIYSSDFDGPGPARHVRHRHITKWMADHASAWHLMRHIPNAYPPDAACPDQTSWSDFFFYSR